MCACMLLHWLNWYGPQTLEQARPYFLRLHRCVRHAELCKLAMNDLQQILWVCVLLCHHRQHHIFCIRKAPAPISGIHCFLIHHPCHDLKVGPEQIIFHSTWREFLRFDKFVLKKITFLVSILLRRECILVLHWHNNVH